MKKIIVLMSVYNGTLYLEEQLQSIINQRFTNEKFEVEILVRDDGSKDGTVSILEKYKEKGLLDYYAGENMGYPKSFWHLLRHAGDADYYAFSDQDDVWFEDKLSRAADRLSHEGDGPLLYCSDVVRVDEKLQPLKEYEIHEKTVVDFPHILIHSFADAGCTCVFNHEARLCMAEYDMEKYCVEGHDLLAESIVSLFGKVVYDEKPGMFYRVHGNNVAAKKRNHIQVFLSRIRSFLFNWDHERSECARSIEEIYKDKIVGNKNARCLHEVAHYRESFRNTMIFLKDRAFRTGKFKHDLFLFIRILVRKI